MPNRPLIDPSLDNFPPPPKLNGNIRFAITQVCPELPNSARMQASTAVSTVGAGSFYLLARFAVGFFVWSFLENLETIILLIFIIFRVNVDSSGCLSGDHFFGFEVKSDVSARVGMACMLCIPLSQSQRYVRHSPGWCTWDKLDNSPHEVPMDRKRWILSKLAYNDPGISALRRVISGSLTSRPSNCAFKSLTHDFQSQGQKEAPWITKRPASKLPLC